MASTFCIMSDVVDEQDLELMMQYWQKEIPEPIEN